jgi:hypothetical protein
MVAIYTVWYNWVRVHKTLRVTPCMAAKVADHIWDWSELIPIMDAGAPKPGPRGPYKKQAIA